MAKSVLELAVGTGQWDAGLKKAKSALDNFTQSQGGLQQALAKDSENMRKFVGMMGQMDSSAKTAKGQMNDYKATIEQLTMQYNRMTESQKQTIGQDYLQSIDQLKQKYQAVNEEIQEMNRSLNNVKAPDIADGVKAGGLFGGGKLDGMLQVFGGNLMTKGVELATSAVTSLISETGDMIKQGVELAKQGEGIRIAFDRLGRGDILDGLREATHGTVTDLELMKAAVKFNDFKLPLDQLGTMLAFAQQKAKDTGQSVDYMVESITNGLGRQSKPILDNLGISAKEIEERMKSTGDFTKAVGAIIRDQMAAAGDYVETAADRAAQANVSLQNKMEELGRKFAPVEEASNQLWTSIKIGILDIIGGPLAELLNGLTEAGRLQNAINNMNGGNNGGPTRIDRMVSMLGNGQSQRSRNTYNKQVATFDERINQQQFRIASLSGNDAITRGLRQKAETELKALETMRAEYISRANDVFNHKAITPLKTTTDPKKGTKEDKDEFTEITGLIGNAQERVSDLQRRIKEAPDETTITILRDQLKEAQVELDRLNGKKVEMVQGLSGFNTQTMGVWLQGRQGDLSKAEYGTKEYEDISANIADMNSIKTVLDTAIKNAIDTTQIDMTPLWSKIFDETLPEGATTSLSDVLTKMYEQAFDSVNIDDASLQDVIDKINEKLKEKKLDGIKIDFNTGEIVRNNRRRKNDKNDDTKYKEVNLTKEFGAMNGGISQIVGGLEQLGIEIPAGLQSVIGGMQAITGILTGISATILAIEALVGADTFLPFAGGGIVHAANGWVGGNSFSGDRIPALLNSGELVLNRAQQGVLADALEGGGIGNLGLSVKVTAEELRFILGNNSRRRGKGEYVTSTRLR